MAAYLGQDKAKVAGTVQLLKHMRAFIRSNGYRAMLDPTQPKWLASELNKEQAQRKLTWLVDMAINRKAGIPDVPSRKHGSDYQTDLRRDAYELNRPRLVIWCIRTPELRKRFAHRLADPADYR